MNYTFHLCFSRLPFNLWTGRISKKSSLPFFAFYDGLYGNNCSEECLSSYSYTGCLYSEKYMVLRLSLFKIFLLFLWQLFIFLHLWIHSLCTLNCLSFLYILSISMYCDWSIIWKTFLFTRMWLTFQIQWNKYFLKILEDWLENFYQQKEAYSKVITKNGILVWSLKIFF